MLSLPYIGILLNESEYRGIPAGNTRFEQIDLYGEAGAMYGVTPVFFRLRDFKPGKKRISAFVKGQTGYIKKTMPAPTVIHNRGIFFSHQAKRRIAGWTGQGIPVFNAWNRHGKLKVHAILMQNEMLRPHLPNTVSATLESLREMMDLYDSLIIKPNNDSIGRGIMKLDRTENGWRLDAPTSRNGKKRRIVTFKEKLPSLLKTMFRARRFLVQQRLPLAEYDGRPFDLRVSVQKDASGLWQVTGIAAKVAKTASFLTNVAQGASIYALEQALSNLPHLKPEAVRRDVTDFSLRAVEQLAARLPHLADVGLDIGVTSEGFPLFIECNGRDLRIIFREGGMYREWKAAYANPIGYARFLWERQKDEASP